MKGTLYDIFEQFGVSDEATTGYLEVLKLGAGTISDIARAVDFPRSSVERYIKELTDRKFLDNFIQKKHRVIVAKSPEYIKGLLEQHVAHFTETISTLRKNDSPSKNQKSRVY